MNIYEKYIKSKSYEDLVKTRLSSVPGSDVYEQVTQEINRIQQDTNNIQIANLISEIQKLKEIASENSISSRRFADWSLSVAIVSILIAIFIGSVQIYLAKIQVEPILIEKYREKRNAYDSCKEPGNWDVADGGATPGSKCKETYIKLKEIFGVFPAAEEGLKKLILPINKIVPTSYHNASRI